MTRGLVTVIIPFWNRERWLAQTVRSVLRQRGVALQLILVDDGSTDRSWAVACAFHDRRVQCVRRPRRLGKAAAVNAVLSKARGTWLAIFDSDDLMPPDSLRVRSRFLERHPQPLAVMGRIGRLIDEQGRPLPADHPMRAYVRAKLTMTRQMARTLGGLIPEIFVYGACPVSPLSVTLIRREAVERLNEQIAYWEDRDYLMRLAAQRPIAFVDTSVLWYRVHGQNSSFRVTGGVVQARPDARRLAAQLQTAYAALRP